MTLELDRVGTFIEPSPCNSWEAGGTFNPGFYKKIGEPLIRFTYRAVPVSGHRPGEFRPGVYLSSVGSGTLAFNPSTRQYSTTRDAEPILTVQPTSHHYDSVRGMGYEDASRLSTVSTPSGDMYTLPYTAVGIDENGQSKVRLGLATSRTADSGTWTEHGVIGPKHEAAKAATIFSINDSDQCGMFFTLWPDSPRSVICYAEFDNLDQLINPSEHYWDDFLDDLDSHVVLRPSANAHRGPEVGGLVKTGAGLLLAVSPESYEEKWDIAFALLDSKNPRELLGHTGSVLTAKTAPEIDGPICKNCVFPGTPILIDKVDMTKAITPENEDDSLLVVPHGQGDISGAFAVVELAAVKEILQL